MRVDLSWTVDRVDGVWFVTCQLHNLTEATCRVRLDSRLEGPVLPPRCRGVPEPGWDVTGLTLELAPDERRGVGFASPVSPVSTDGDDIDRPPTPPDPPVVVTDSVPVDPDESVSTPTAADAVRRLGDHRPPRAVVAGPPTFTSPASTTAASMAGTESGAVAGGETASSQPAGETPSLDGTAAITAWLDTVEARVERAECLTDSDLETATAALEEIGSAAAAVDLAHQVDADTSRLTQIADRASSLARRAEATDVPVEPLEQLT